MKADYTVVIQTFNEQERVLLAIRNFAGRARILVVDNCSTDDTRNVAEKAGASVITVKNNGFLTDNEYRQIFEHVGTDWFLLMFCSHHFPTPLIDVCEEAMASGKYDAIALDGMTIQYGIHTKAYGINKRMKVTCTRWIKKSCVDLSKYVIHTEIQFTGSQERMFYPELRDDMLIHNYRDDDIMSMSRKASTYAYGEARQKLDAGKTPSVFRLVSCPVREFFKRLLWRGCILEGWQGITVAISLSFARFCVEACMFELYYESSSADMKRKNIEARSKLLSME